MSFSRISHDAALALLAGRWETEACVERISQTFGRHLPWIDLLMQRIFRVMSGPQPPSLRWLERFLQRDNEFRLACIKHRLKTVQHLLTPTPMIPKPGAPSTWPVPALVTEDDICRWLSITPEHLTWIADVNGRERSRPPGPLRQYVYRWLPKRSGGWRLIEMPKSKLKQIQRRILSDILNKIPAHASSHGFVKEGSIMSFVSPHTHQALVVRMDLKDFFISIPASRVHAIFRTLGYSESIARVLTGLCTNSVPTDAMSLPDKSQRLPGYSAAALRTPHLPQGAPTSPALANLCAYRLDARLTGLAKRFDWFYTRYADDLLFSGPHSSAKFLKQLQIWVGAIAIEENLNLNFRKTRIMSKARRQHAGGLVLNEKPNVSRDSYDQLKAILHNCVKQGPAAQNRENRDEFRAHLLGRVTHVSHVNLARGIKLRRLFDQIQWATAI